MLNPSQILWLKSLSPSIHLSITHLIIYLPSTTHRSTPIYSSTHLLIHPPIRSFTHPSTHPHNHPSIHPPIHPSTHSSAHSSIQTIVHPSKNAFIHPLTNLTNICWAPTMCQALPRQWGSSVKLCKWNLCPYGS